MATQRAYEEIIDFIASGTSPRGVIDFQPSEKSKERVSYLIRLEKAQELSQEERAELDHYLQIEHMMRLAKARARRKLINE